MRHDELVEETERLLRRHGFRSIVNRFSPDSCFDIAAKSEGISLLIKALEDLSDASREIVEELSVVAKWAHANALILAERAGDEELDEDAVYMRNGVYAISVEALRRTLEGDPPLVEVGPAGCFVYIDGETVRKRREELGLSVGELARLVGVSRMTIYSYERGRRRTTPRVAYRLAFVLGVPVTVPVDPLRPREERASANLGGAFSGPPLKGLLRIVAEVLRRLGMAARALARAPFEMLAGREERKLAVNIVDCGGYDKAKIEFTRDFADLTGLRQLVVRPEGYECPDGVPSVGLEELKNVRDPDELVKIVAS